MKINGKDYKVVPGYGTVVKFCIENKIEFHEFLEKFSPDDGKLTNEFFLNLAGYTKTMIERAGEEAPDIYEIIDWLGTGGVEEITKLLFEGLSVPKNLKATAKDS